MDNPAFLKMIHLDKDVPKGLMHGAKWWPFGRYLVDKLRQMIETGWTDEQWYLEIRQKYLDAIGEGDTRVFWERMRDETRQQVLNLETREKMYSQKRRLHHAS